MNITEKRIKKMLDLIESAITVCTHPIDEVYYKECDYKEGSDMPSSDGFSAFPSDGLWGKVPDSHGWFLLKGTIPKKYSFCKLRLHIDTSKDGWNVYNPQFILYSDGKAVQGLDTYHRFVDICYTESYEFYLYAYTGSMGSNLNFRRYFEIIDEKAEKLYYDLSVLYETAVLHKENDKEYADIISAVIRAINLLDFRDTSSPSYRSSVELALECVESFYSSYCADNKNKVVCVGHTHIDVAWLWTLAQTKEKAQHTFSTVLKLMDIYPSLKFMSSQPQLLKYVKEEAPELYARIKEKVKEGRFELEGGMWVEADCNLTSGESLVRQIVHGKRFFKDEFGVDSKVLWLPDVFGYSASLPQICLKSGIDTFVTSKISWNDTNRMPHDVFKWIGIDGSELFTYFLTAQQKKRDVESPNYTTYVATSDPDYVSGCFERFSDKGLSDRVLLTMGWGDGGGGPTYRMCEKALRLEKGVTGCPQVIQETVTDFISSLKATVSERGELPVWDGELYLEYHRGTYTSAALNKYLNRHTECRLGNTELWNVMSKLLCNTRYPEKELYNNWETLLLNQFHDILPGSCIPEVYKVSRQQYNDVNQSLDKLDASALSVLSALSGGDTVFNPTMQTSATVCDNDGSYVYYPSLPKAGFRASNGDTSSTAVFGERSIETPYYIARLDENGYICSLYDKQAEREAVKNNTFGRLAVYEDLPFQYDCWNIEEYHEEKRYDVNGLVSVKEIQLGSGAGFEVKRRFMASEITQRIIFFEHSRRIDFVTTVDWKESNLLLKTEFESDINNIDGMFDIQYGFIKRPANRNTSWEKAKFETCGQKYVDISDGGYGLALMNNCKYGYSVARGRITLSLIKASRYPNEYIDREVHRFTYSAFLHEDDFRASGVIGEAELLNNPPVIVKNDSGFSERSVSFSLVSCNKPNISLGAVKQAYDGNGIIFRFAESFDKRTVTDISFGFDVKNAYICDMNENIIEEAAVNNNSVSLCFKPFEIITVKIL